MFDLTSVWILLLVFAIIGAFWKLRSFAELARVAAKDYCQKHGLQLLSVAMANVRIRFHKGLLLVVTFDLNYSPEGITAKQGEIEIVNGKVNQIFHWS